MLIKVDKHIKHTTTNYLSQTSTDVNIVNNEVEGTKTFKINIYGGLKLWITFIFIIFLENGKAQNTFLNEQMNFSRFESAYNSKAVLLENEFLDKNLDWPVKEIFIRCFKYEQELEIWVKEGDIFVLFKVYDICRGSGTYGPKLMQGDAQVPEGFYYIDRFNPVSSFHLSLGINYPNKADLLRTSAVDPGGDIFIHGDCVTVGCLPMTDDKMEEIYLLSVLASNEGQDKIPVYIFPYKFNILMNTIFGSLFEQYAGFWNSLEEEYDRFNNSKVLNNFWIDDNGTYIFSN